MSALALGIETSCDETAVALVDARGVIHANAIASQRALHRRYGGVVPELASRRHVELILPVLEEALAEAGASPADVDLVAVTRGPGLLGALMVGVTAAKALALAWDRPLVGVHHLAGHVVAGFLRPRATPGAGDAASGGPGRAEPSVGTGAAAAASVPPAPTPPAADGDLPPWRRGPWPTVCLVVSGGHTDLYLLHGDGRVQLLGRTRDDAAGEAFDKVARLLGLGYPGGPAIDRLAQRGDPRAIPFPRAMRGSDDLDFSFSGLKTAVAYYLEESRRRGETPDPADVAASFQQAVADVLVEKTLRAVERTGARRVVLGGGVAANSALRRGLVERLPRGVELVIPPPALCTDNAAMIAAAGLARFLRGEVDDLDLDVVAREELTRL